MIILGKGEPIIKTRGIHFREGQDENIVLPSVGVGVFSRQLYEDIISKYQCKEVGCVKNANSESNIYILKYKETEITFFMAPVSSSRIASNIEELSFNGIKTFIIFGNCGVLDNTIPDCGIIIPTRAYRDEGASYHYIPESEYLDLDNTYKDIFKDVLKEYDFDYREGYTWTTDAFYRETRDKFDYFKNKGCVCVEMEASAIAAVCKYKNLNYFTFYYAGDNLDSVNWDERSLSGLMEFDKKKMVAILALELAKKIVDK